MSFLRAGATAVLALLVSSASLASAQLTLCTPLVGDANLYDYPEALAVGPDGIIQAVGYYTSPDVIDSGITQFIFQYVVPDQTDYQTPNRLKFAMYTNVVYPDPNGLLPQLVAESQVVTIQSGVTGNQEFVAKVARKVSDIQPSTDYVLAVWNEFNYLQFIDPHALQPDEVTYPYDASQNFPHSLPVVYTTSDFQFPVTYSGCTGQAVGDPVFTGFNGEKFLVKGVAERIYNVLSLPQLQLNTRFIPLSAGQAMNRTQQSSVRQRQSKLLSAMKGGAGAANRLPSTTSWSHDGMYMGETGVQLAGHKLYVVPAAYESGFGRVELDGAELPVSSEAVRLLDGSSILRSSSSVVEITTAQVMFTLINSDHFLNIHSALLTVQSADVVHVDGLLGQTISPSFHVEKTAEFKQHIENDFMLPEGADVWSTSFEHNQYQTPAGTQ